MASSTIEEPKLPGGYLVTPRVPQGLAAAVEGLTREVIRHSPDDIYVFAARHFEKLLKIREKCGITGEKSSSDDVSLRALREMSRALRMREIDRGKARKTRSSMDNHQAGWSLNQTAKVLKRHRSIFGDEGRRITTDEIFGMASQTENHSSSPKLSARKIEDRGEGSIKDGTMGTKKTDDLWQASTSGRRCDRTSEEQIVNRDIRGERTRAGPRIITRIPNLPSGTIMLAKDIKTELRKNRISSRERRNVRGRHEEKSTSETSDGRIGRSSDKSSSSKKPCDNQGRIKERKTEQKQSRKNYDSTARLSSRERQHEHKSRAAEDDPRSVKGNSQIRTPGMDRVKDYVVEGFAATRSLEELQTSNYVEKVQVIIDETGPIIKEKIDKLKSGMIGRADKNYWLAEKNRPARSDDSSSEKSNGPSRQKDSSEEPTSQSSSGDALRTRLTEMQKLLENVSSSIARTPRRSRSARSNSRRYESFSIHDETGDSSKQNEGLETRLSKTRDLLENISATLSRPARRSSSAKCLRMNRETMVDTAIGNDALKKRLNETRNLLHDISANFGKSMDKGGTNGGTAETEEVSSYSDDRAECKMSLPAVISTSVRNSSGSVSRSDSENLVLPAITPEAPKSAKITENLILPALSPTGNASTSEDSSRIADSNDVIRPEDIDILEISSEDYTPEVPIENLSRDSLNVTPDFDSIPQRPDSLEPVEIIDDALTRTPEIGDLEERIIAVDELRTKSSEIDDREAKIPEIAEPETSKVSAVDESGGKTSDARDPEARTSNSVEDEVASGPLATSRSQESENFVAKNDRRELEDAGKQVHEIFDMENPDVGEMLEKYADPPVVTIDGSTASCEKIDGDEEPGIEEGVDRPGEADEARGNDESRLEELERDRSTNYSPEPLDCTYVLTEGSPYDIPDTVTTVIIPERTIDSPLSDRLDIELADGVEAKLFLIHGDKTSQIQETFERDNESVDKDIERLDTDEALRKDSERIAAKSSARGIEKGPKTSPDETSMENMAETADEEDTAPKSLSDPFGEIVRPESIEATSTDVDFIREIESIRDMKISRKDLGRINEELSEDLEDLDERIEATMKNVGETLIIKEEDPKEEDPKESEDDGKEGNEEREIKDNDEEVDESRIIESDLSPEAARPDNDSESSNETKESGATDESPESAKRENSLDDEEASSDTRTPESSNEVKETTLTDGPSLSLDPTRPFVPELNLDSLQDLTVSSFKMTEEDYENPEHGESGNTISIADTLTSDEYNRTNDNDEFLEEAIPEEHALLSPSASSRTIPNEINEGTSHGEEEIAEETIVKCRVRAKEDICVKTSTYVTGPSTEEDNVDNYEVAQVAQVDEEKGGKKPEEDVKEESINVDIAMPENEEKTSKEEKEEIATIELSDDRENVKIVETKKEEERASKDDKEAVTSNESLNEKENAENVKTRKGDENESKEEKEEIGEMENISERMKVEVGEIEEKEEKNRMEKRLEKEEPERSLIVEKLECETNEEDDNDANSKISHPRKMEEIVDQLDRAEDEEIPNDSADKTARFSMENDETGNSNEEMAMGDEESDDMLEEGYIEDETPLAVSRSASQCTTRRVSSGNLAKLRDDPTLGWTEEIEHENENSENDDTSSSNVKFSGVTGETIKEQGSEEINHDPVTSRVESNETKLNETTKNSTEYHVYVPEVDASDDNTTSESSTFDSAVTKIQAGVRGFLVRRRLQRGHQNRNSTLNSIASIQDSTAIEPYRSSERDREASDEKLPSHEEETLPNSSASVSDKDLANSATTIPSNCRGYEARKRLRREDAVQRATLSLEKSFSHSGLRHTGEFHDCIALPVHDIAIETKAPGESRNIGKSDDSTNKIMTESPNDNIQKSSTTANMRYKDDDDSTGKYKEMPVKISIDSDLGKTLLFDQSSNRSIVKLGTRPNLDRLVDLIVLAKDEAALQGEYLNFITSVEDTENIVDSAFVPSCARNFHDEEPKSGDSLREPLALSDSPFGVIIEEVTSSGAENFMKIDEDHDRTTVSTNSSVRAPAEVTEESSDSTSLANASGSMEAHQADGKISISSGIGQVETESLGATSEVSEHAEEPDKSSDRFASDRTSACSSNAEKTEDSVVLENETMLKDLAISKSLSSIREKELLGPESSVDSIECSTVGAEEKTTFDTSDMRIDASASTGDITKDITGKMASPMEIDSSNSSQMNVKKADEESIGSNVDDESSLLSFSGKVDDLLGLSSEEDAENRGKKRILEVTLRPGDIMKSMSLSQESQLAGERIESPVTMIQIAPERSGSLKLDEISDNCDEEATRNGENVAAGPSLGKLDEK